MLDFGITDGAMDSRIHLVAPQGEIDLATANELKNSLLDAIETNARCLIVDLSDVSFVDSTGLGVLLFVQRRMEASGGRIVTVCGDPLVRRIFEVTGVMSVLSVVETRSDAVTHAQEFALAG